MLLASTTLFACVEAAGVTDLATVQTTGPTLSLNRNPDAFQDDVC
jgi:hypothetical protein